VGVEEKEETEARTIDRSIDRAVDSLGAFTWLAGVCSEASLTLSYFILVGVLGSSVVFDIFVFFRRLLGVIFFGFGRDSCEILVTFRSRTTPKRSARRTTKDDASTRSHQDDDDASGQLHDNVSAFVLFLFTWDSGSHH